MGHGDDGDSPTMISLCWDAAVDTISRSFQSSASADARTCPCARNNIDAVPSDFQPFVGHFPRSAFSFSGLTKGHFARDNAAR